MNVNGELVNIKLKGTNIFPERVLHNMKDTGTNIKTKVVFSRCEDSNNKR